eukprot:3707596-Pyramimonas_sp.AAC.1
MRQSTSTTRRHGYRRLTRSFAGNYPYELSARLLRRLCEDARDIGEKHHSPRTHLRSEHLHQRVPTSNTNTARQSASLLTIRSSPH